METITQTRPQGVRYTNCGPIQMNDTEHLQEITNRARALMELCRGLAGAIARAQRENEISSQAVDAALAEGECNLLHLRWAHGEQYLACRNAFRVVPIVDDRQTTP